jgi:hypothetical protein
MAWWQRVWSLDTDSVRISQCDTQPKRGHIDYYTFYDINSNAYDYKQFHHSGQFSVC